MLHHFLSQTEESFIPRIWLAKNNHVAYILFKNLPADSARIEVSSTAVDRASTDLLVSTLVILHIEKRHPTLEIIFAGSCEKKRWIEARIWSLQRPNQYKAYWSFENNPFSVCKGEQYFWINACTKIISYFRVKLTFFLFEMLCNWECLWDIRPDCHQYLNAWMLDLNAIYDLQLALPKVSDESLGRDET